VKTIAASTLALVVAVGTLVAGLWGRDSGSVVVLAAGAPRGLISDGGMFAPSIIFDDRRGVFRLWYHGPSARARIDVLHRESPDGLTWGPATRLYSGDAWGTNVLRDGDRYRWLTYQIQAKNGVIPGMYAGQSADGLRWQLRGPLLRFADGVGDIVDLFRDPIRGRWGGFVKLFAKPREFGPDPRMASVRRLTGVTSSDDFEQWAAPMRAFVPDAADEGEIEFYGAACCVVRDRRLVAFLRVLRDDVGEGIGYTVLAWSDDGVTWERARVPFLDRCPRSFDASTAWVYGVTEHDGTIYLAYSAYDTGHKVGDRAVAIATLPSHALRLPDGAGPGCGP
jgi:hypothetical protein